ncbi:MAG: YncE family protein [Bacteroidales bacterium]|nr:YncE family protein [Bacteroidales bacterium]
MIIGIITGLLFVFSTYSCRKDETIPEPDPIVVDTTQSEITAVKGFYLLNEGNMGSNKASLDYYDYATKTYTKNIYGSVNPAIVRLGDVGNDLQIYGNRLYAVINCSNLVEVMDVATTKSITNFKLDNCRYITFHDGKAYVSSYVAPVEFNPEAQPGIVAEFDTVTYRMLRSVTVGYQPEEMAIVGNKLYVANSGGYRFPDYDNTISVIDLNTFTVSHSIEVAYNLHHLKVDSEGDLYVSSRGDYYDIASNLLVIDTKTDKIKKSFGIPASNMCVNGDSLYVYSVEWNYNSGKNTVTYAIIDTKTEEIVSRNFITDGTDEEIKIPYGLAIDPISKDIYVTDAKNYVTPGTLYCFDREGKKKWSVTTGDIPAHIAFVTE